MQRHSHTRPDEPDDTGEAHPPLYAARVPLQADDALHFIGTEVPPPVHLPYAATVGAEVPGGAIMYWGEGGQRTPLHYDPYENFMCASECDRSLAHVAACFYLLHSGQVGGLSTFTA